jgi:hypothetical protein
MKAGALMRILCAVRRLTGAKFCSCIVLMQEISESDLNHALCYAVRRVAFKAKGKFLEGDQAEMIAQAILTHMRLCRWKVMHEPMPWHSAE